MLRRHRRSMAMFRAVTVAELLEPLTSDHSVSAWNRNSTDTTCEKAMLVLPADCQMISFVLTQLS